MNRQAGPPERATGQYWQGMRDQPGIKRRHATDIERQLWLTEFAEGRFNWSHV
jgi:hypothetical protein